MLAAVDAIEVQGLSKIYRIYPSPRDLLRERLFGGVRHVAHQALADIALTVARGEVVGIMGPNGAGKSTLLKIITGTLPPTTGRVAINGRVSAILELGTGFTPHNTGRENIVLGCLVRGMTPDEIARRTGDIIAFSELADVIDRPFGTYSTGMQARLTFAVAIAAEPEILIVDEALAVGDARFQQKCFGRIRDMRQRGTSILLVSHDDNTIATFCDRALILLGGRCVAEGTARSIVPLYHKLLFDTDAACVNPAAPLGDGGGDVPAPTRIIAPAVPRLDPPADPSAFEPGMPPELADAARQAYGDGRAQLVDIAIRDAAGRRVDTVCSGDRCTLSFRLRAAGPLCNYTLGFAIRDRRATVVWGLTTTTQKMESPALPADGAITCAVTITVWLAEGDYTVSLGAADATSGAKIAHTDGIVALRVTGPGGIFTTALVNLDSRFHLAPETAGNVSNGTGEAS